MSDALLAMLADAPRDKSLRALARIRREYAAALIERAIDALDAYDGDADLEPEEDIDPLDLGEEDNADREPCLGAQDGNLYQPLWAQGSADGRERDDDFEPTLGQPEGIYHNQTAWGRIGGPAHEDEDDERRLPGYREGMRLTGGACG